MMNKTDILRKKLSGGPPPPGGPGPMGGPPPGGPGPADTPGYPGDQTDPTALPNEPAPPGVQDTTAGPDPQDLQTISQAAANDPVIAAIARVLGLPI